jgi:hypothetical protein
MDGFWVSKKIPSQFLGLQPDSADFGWRRGVIEKGRGKVNKKPREMVSKPHLASDGCVANRFEMLTYFVYAPLPKRFDALPSNTIWGFETISV